MAILSLEEKESNNHIKAVKFTRTMSEFVAVASSATFVGLPGMLLDTRPSFLPCTGPYVRQHEGF